MKYKVIIEYRFDVVADSLEEAESKAISNILDYNDGPNAVRVIELDDEAK